MHHEPLPGETRGSNNVFLQAWDGAQRGEGTVRTLFAGVVGVLFVGAVHGIWHELHRTDRREFGAPPQEPKGGGSGSGGGGGAFAGEDAESRVLGLRNLVDLRRALGGEGGERDPRPRCWFGEQCYRKNPRHMAAFAHPGERDWFSCASVPRVRIAGPTAAALAASARHFQAAGGSGGSVPLGSAVCYLQSHLGLLQQFLRIVSAKVQRHIHLDPQAQGLTDKQFCVVLQASRETARLLGAGATAEDIRSCIVIISHTEETAAGEKSKGIVSAKPASDVTDVMELD